MFDDSEEDNVKEKCTMEDYKKNKEFLNEIESIKNNIYKILNKDIESTIEQRNDIYKYISTTDFSDNSYFLNVKEEILKIINNNNNLLEEYNNFKANQKGGINLKNIASAAFLGFAALANAITYHANPSDYATSLQNLDSSKSLVTYGNSLGTCGYSSMAVIHGDKLKKMNIKKNKPDLVSFTRNGEKRIGFNPNFPLSSDEQTETIVLNGLPINKEKLFYGKNINTKISDFLSKDGPFIKELLKDKKTVGEYRTMLSTSGFFSHARVLIIDINGNLAVFDPNYGLIYSKEYGRANPETIKSYKDVGRLSKEVSSVPDWVVNNQNEISQNGLSMFSIDISNSGEASVSSNSLKEMEVNIANEAANQYAPYKSVSNVRAKEGFDEWQNEYAQKSRGGGDSPNDDITKDNSLLDSRFDNGKYNDSFDFISKFNEDEKKNPYQPNSKKYEIYQSYILYNIIHPENSEYIENLKKELKDRRSSNNPQAIKKPFKLTQAEIREQNKSEEKEMLQNYVTNGITIPNDYSLSKGTRRERRESERKKKSKKGGKTKKTKKLKKISRKKRLSRKKQNN